MYQYGNVAVQYKTKQEKLKKQVLRQQLPQNKPDKSSKNSIPAKEKLTYLFAVSLFVMTLSILLSLNAQISQTNYEIQHIERETEAVRKQITELDMKVQALAAPERIMTIATEKLGLTSKGASVKILSNQSTESTTNLRNDDE